MSLSVLLGELGDLLRQGKDRIGKIRGLGEAERFRNAELFLLLDRMDGQLGEFEKKLTSAFGSGLADYEAVKFLNNMLQLEYRGIIDYNLYASAFADRDIREKFRKFGAVEIEHARMIIALIRKMGGTPGRSASTRSSPRGSFRRSTRSTSLRPSRSGSTGSTSRRRRSISTATSRGPDRSHSAGSIPPERRQPR